MLYGKSKEKESSSYFGNSYSDYTMCSSVNLDNTAGAYERVESAQGVKVIAPDSFHYIEKSPVNPLKIFNIGLNGFNETSTLIFLILFSGASFNIITMSGALQSLIGAVSKNKE